MIQRGRTPVALVAPERDPQLLGQGMELVLIVGQQMRPTVLAAADGGPLPPVVDVDGQRRAQGRSRRSGVGLFHHRPLKRQVWWAGSCSSGRPGCGHTSWAAAAMAAS